MSLLNVFVKFGYDLPVNFVQRVSFLHSFNIRSCKKSVGGRGSLDDIDNIDWQETPIYLHSTYKMHVEFCRGNFRMTLYFFVVFKILILYFLLYLVDTTYVFCKSNQHFTYQYYFSLCLNVFESAIDDIMTTHGHESSRNRRIFWKLGRTISVAQRAFLARSRQCHCLIRHEGGGVPVFHHYVTCFSEDLFDKMFSCAGVSKQTIHTKHSPGEPALCYDVITIYHQDLFKQSQMF